ncbi:MAG TPA: hypothetical protein VNR11_18530 [Xanthobacteraceae bacterium]|nr:hypothetical protein [Xanthobacteraceae bacterium]
MANQGPTAQKSNLLPLCRQALAVMALGATLAACSSTLASLPTELGGLPADTPARREADPLAYPAVHDMPPPRASTPMTPQQVKQAEVELILARDRQAKQSSEAKEATSR